MKSSFLILLITSLLQACLWFVVLRADPFGMSTAADRASESVFLRLYPILYPPNSRDRIQVVMIEEDRLPLPLGKGASREWPLGFDEHVALIKRIVAFKPKAVFIDVLFDTERGRDPSALEALFRDLSSDVSLVFAAYRDPKKQQRVIMPLRALPSVGAGPLSGFVESVAPPNHYQLRDRDGRLSAAAVLYNATFDAALGGAKLGPGSSSDMLLAWGNTVTDAGARFSECVAITDNPSSRLAGFIAAIRLGVERAFRTGGEEERVSWERQQPCAYHAETSANELFNGAEDTLSDKLRGAYVFVGANISGSGDVVTSPVHGQLPGVYMHAMALDNLLTFRDTPMTTSELVWIPQVVLVFLCTLIGATLFAKRDAPQGRGAAVRDLALRLVLWTIFAALVLLLVVVLSFEFKWAPYNWGSVLAVAGVVFFAGAGKAFLVLVRGQS